MSIIWIYAFVYFIIKSEHMNLNLIMLIKRHTLVCSYMKDNIIDVYFCCVILFLDLYRFCFVIYSSFVFVMIDKRFLLSSCFFPFLSHSFCRYHSSNGSDIFKFYFFTFFFCSCECIRVTYPFCFACVWVIFNI